jgi:DNA polymerase elongation subunit (family B)
MPIYLQPADWVEHDINFNYVVDAIGRTNTGDVARVRLTGFQPYLYLRAESETPSDITNAFQNAEKPIRGVRITLTHKQDAMRGFSKLETVRVWKLQCKSLWTFKAMIKALKTMRIGKRQILTEDVYEADLPPMLRLFHERDISPASPFQFEEETGNADEDEQDIDAFYENEYTLIQPHEKISIPLYVASYDLEVYSSTGQFPVSSNPGDEITQIGISFRWNDMLLQSEARYVFVNGKCEPSTDSTVVFVECRNEKELLQKFTQCIHDENPDIVVGYNTFGFDDAYVADRARHCNLKLEFGRRVVKQWGDRRENVKTEKKAFELAAGKFAVRYINMPGRMTIDLYLSMRREQNLDSYKLDSIASKFLRDKVVSMTRLDETHFKITTKTTRGLFVGNLVRLDLMTNTTNPYKEGRKFPVVELTKNSFVIETDDDFDGLDFTKLEWSFAKDDVDHHQIFAAHRGTPADRSNIAKYCIQDCDLVLTLIAKLDTLVNARGMADVCRVPIQYIFLRGQGIKIYSAVVYNASKRNQIIMTQDSVDGDTSYEGAIVLPPKIGMYLDQPISVLDFNSLYPSNMIAYNLSPDTLVYVKKYNMEGAKTYQWPETIPDTTGFKVDEISYDERNDENESVGRVICGFSQPTDDGKNIGLLPMTLDILLKKRKETRKKMEQTDDDAQKSVFNGLQLAYKVVANSVYGQCGSKTSAIRNLYVAACTTATGRHRIYDAKKIVETEFGGDVIYGDTDSIFIKFPTKDLGESIKMGQMAADKITQTINRKPYRIEYEKTLFPFILFCRKRYVGMLYEDDPNKKPKRKEMGIALKRRDSAPIVKDIFGGALDILLEERDIRKAQSFVQDMLVKVMQNQIPLDKFIITKQLRDDYKNPDQIAHAVLAERMKDRDEGSAPQVGDRLAYIYVAERKDKKKQGDKIEQVDYVRANGLKPDVELYITNQIQNPVAQLFALALEQLDGYQKRTNYTAMMAEYLEAGKDEEEATLLVLKKKEKELESLMFLGAQYLKKHKRGPMDMFVRR